MITPPFLQPGDSIYLLSTARSASLADVTPFINWLESNQFKVIIGESIGPVYHQFAGDDELRKRDFQKAIDHKEVKAIWCARGGYGSVRMMRDVSLLSLKKYPKWLVGFSDVTALHGIFQNQNTCSLHNWMAVQFPQISEKAKKRSLEILTGKRPSLTFEKHPLNTSTEIYGRVVGGNLSILYSMLGSCDLPQVSKPGILFIEEIDEYLYHVDRMMHALRRSGFLRRFSGILVGGMTDMNDHEIPFGWSAEEIIQEHALQADIPVIFNLPTGHLNDHQGLILGEYCRAQETNGKMILEQ
jgi:muramoyltetrapeptide carboxypeptidase